MPASGSVLDRGPLLAVEGGVKGKSTLIFSGARAADEGAIDTGTELFNPANAASYKK
ncbi:MAG: hypothetical protein ABIS06_20185 [Vicinamibacterales bacterium]